MPFLSEKLWQQLFNKDKFLMLQTFTTFESTENFKLSKINIDIMISIIVSIRNLRSELNIPYKKSINIFIETKNIVFK